MHERAVPRLPLGDVLDFFELRQRFVGDDRRARLVQQIGELVADRLAERAIRVANLPVARDDDDELVRFFDSRTHEPQLRVDLPQLGALDGQPRHQQRQHRHDGDRHREILERVERPGGRLRAAIRNR